MSTSISLSTRPPAAGPVMMLLDLPGGTGQRAHRPIPVTEFRVAEAQPRACIRKVVLVLSVERCRRRRSEWAELKGNAASDVGAALSRHPGLTVETSALTGTDPGWVTTGGGLRLRPDYWPERGGMDGFFMARLRLS